MASDVLANNWMVVDTEWTAKSLRLAHILLQPMPSGFSHLNAIEF
jgi:hypothetical protein